MRKKELTVLDGVKLSKNKEILLECSPEFSGEFVIPDCVTTIGFAAFRYCRELTAVAIPDSVSLIMSEAFWGCGMLHRVVVPDVCVVEPLAFGLFTEILTKSQEATRIQELFAGVLASGIGVHGAPAVARQI